MVVATVAIGAWFFLGQLNGAGVTSAAACGDTPANTFVFVPGGGFQMGSNDYYPDEAPIRDVVMEGFWIRRTEITNAEFRAFVAATGYVTVAERAPPEGVAPGSAVFVPAQRGEPIRPMSWWHWVPGADWRHPEGPGSSIDGRDGYPVTQIAYEDALAFAEWAGETLPNEAQWEYAASAGGTVSDSPYRIEDGAPHPIANTWQGLFPVLNTGEDGFLGTSPAGCFEANAFELHDMIGNVWEWTATPATGTARGVIKGGSYLCAPNYCMRYRPAAREAQETGLGTNHIGFRTIRTAPPPQPAQSQ